MNILAISTDSTDNGVGIRTVIYVAGCSHFCKFCHNPKSWNPNAGTEYSIDEILEKVIDNPIANVTISGGDPLTFQYEGTLELAKAIKERTGKNIWLYTGYTYEELPEEKKEILNYIDCLVDGKFMYEKRDLTLHFRGSTNQRIIDVPRTLKEGKVCLWKDGEGWI